MVLRVVVVKTVVVGVVGNTEPEIVYGVWCIDCDG